MTSDQRKTSRKANSKNSSKANTNQKTYHQWLKDLAAIPTASGREGLVASYIASWVKARRSLSMTADVHGNLTIARAKSPTRVARRRGSGKAKPAVTQPPLYIEAHMDHPAFVVHQVVDEQTILADFRGGVNDSYFVNTPILLHTASGNAIKGKVVAFESKPAKSSPIIADGVKILRIKLAKKTADAQTGDIVTWDTGKARIAKGRLHAPACDNLASVAAALSAYDQWLNSKAKNKADLRLLFTRAEEIGFVGAIAACKAGTIPKDARIVVLENSKSYAESPIDGGPIVRVGDRTSTFDPDLTFRCANIGTDLASSDKTFKFQRKLMLGGTCEASAFQIYGYTATCLCLPLGNYHNMNDDTGKIAAETISTKDFDGLVKFLVAIAMKIDDPAVSPSLLAKLESIYASKKAVLDEPSI